MPRPVLWAGSDAAGLQALEQIGARGGDALTAVPAAVAWFAPVLLIKLLLGHLLPGQAAPREGR